MMDREGFSSDLQLAAKRFIDVSISTVGLIVLSPIFAGIAIAVKLNSKGPVVYKHCRIGKDGISFDLYKFRSMVSGGDDKNYMLYLQELIESEKNGDGQAMPYRKMETDPRVTAVGEILRTYYLDELPQLWNVLKGDMSLVGPRPHVQFEVDHYTDEQRRRLSVRPGLTGLWQVSGKADCSFNELIAMDLEYIDQWNLLRDLKFVLTTFALMLRGGERFWARMSKRLPGTKPAPLPIPQPAPQPAEETISPNFQPTLQPFRREAGD
jgi:lipopolysaccharide/colanic/teichoic acid biosynthesis glycosyltransferase